MQSDVEQFQDEEMMKEKDDTSMAERMLALANQMKEHLQTEFNANGVKQLEEFIERIRGGSTEDENFDSCLETCGAFLGQCLVEDFGGKWKNDYMSVMIHDRIQVFVFSQAAKQFQNGLNDSVFFKAKLYPAILRFTQNERKAAQL